jgi:hypothetical protein
VDFIENELLEEIDPEDYTREEGDTFRFATAVKNKKEPWFLGMREDHEQLLTDFCTKSTSTKDSYEVFLIIKRKRPEPVTIKLEAEAPGASGAPAPSPPPSEVSISSPPSLGAITRSLSPQRTMEATPLPAPLLQRRKRARAPSGISLPRTRRRYQLRESDIERMTASGPVSDTWRANRG